MRKNSQRRSGAEVRYTTGVRSRRSSPSSHSSHSLTHPYCVGELRLILRGDDFKLHRLIAGNLCDQHTVLGKVKRASGQILCLSNIFVLNNRTATNDDFRTGFAEPGSRFASGDAAIETLPISAQTAHYGDKTWSLRYRKVTQ
jgi:hypothetical protein